MNMIQLNILNLNKTNLHMVGLTYGKEYSSCFSILNENSWKGAFI